jgi:hypothetical protein
MSSPSRTFLLSLALGTVGFLVFVRYLSTSTKSQPRKREDITAKTAFRLHIIPKADGASKEPQDQPGILTYIPFVGVREPSKKPENEAKEEVEVAVKEGFKVDKNTKIHIDSISQTSEQVQTFSSVVSGNLTLQLDIHFNGVTPLHADISQTSVE